MYWAGYVTAMMSSILGAVPNKEETCRDLLLIIRPAIVRAIARAEVGHVLPHEIYIKAEAKQLIEDGVING